MITPDEGPSLETSIFALSFQVVREPLPFAYRLKSSLFFSLLFIPIPLWGQSYANTLWKHWCIHASNQPYLEAFSDTTMNNSISAFHCKWNLLANPMKVNKLHCGALINLFLKSNWKFVEILYNVKVRTHKATNRCNKSLCMCSHVMSHISTLRQLYFWFVARTKFSSELPCSDDDISCCQWCVAAICRLACFSLQRCQKAHSFLLT